MAITRRFISSSLDDSHAHDRFALDCLIVISHPGGGFSAAANSRSKKAARSERE
jgi:hypothetical protein